MALGIEGRGSWGRTPPSCRALLESFEAGFFNRATLSSDSHRQDGWQTREEYETLTA